MTIFLEWLHTATGIPVELSGKLFASLVGIGILILLRLVVLKTVWRQTEDFRIRYQWRKLSSHAMFFLIILLVGRVWFEEFQSVATFLGLVSAGLVIALKDLLVNLAGWLFIVWRRPFEVGDRIQVGGFSGDVIDLRIFQFTLMEIGNWVHADQNTGRIIHVPNGKVFTEPQVNYTRGWFDYIWNEIPVLVTFESDWKKAKEILKEIGTNRGEHLTTAAAFKMKDNSQKFMIFSPNLEPAVYTSVEESGVLLTIRYLCEPRNRRDSAQSIWEDILEQFARCSDIDFAYPTKRFYSNASEGKPGARVGEASQNDRPAVPPDKVRSDHPRTP